MSKPKTPTLSRTLILFLLAGIAISVNDPLTADDSRPNIIFILADDLGYGDVGFMGQTNFDTPCLDRMAREGMVFSQFYAGSTVCAPSRACLLTGHHTGHVYQRFNGKVQFREDDQDITIARMLKNNGYSTAMIGKSGLACNSNDAGLPNRKGFDYSYGYLAHAAAHRYYPKTLWENGTKITFENNHGKNGDTYSGQLILEKSLQWIDEHRESPFFLHIALQQPHADLAVPKEFRDRHVGQFEEKPYPDGKHYRAESHPQATFVGMVQYLDHSVGQVLDKLVEHGIDKNTYVFFSSDNGPHFEGGAHPDHFDSNGPLRGGKRDLYEGGIRVPFVAWAPGRIAAGSQSDHLAAFWDFPATACELTGTTLSPEGDGISFAPTLSGNGQQATHDYLYWEFYEGGGKQAIRQNNWKAIRLNAGKNPDGPVELYDLDEDLGETNDVAKSNPAIVQQLNQLMTDAHEPHPEKRFSHRHK